MHSPASQYVDSILSALHARALDKDDPQSIPAARTILQYDIAHQRLTAYTERCRILNERTSRTPEPSPRNSGVHPPGRAVKTDSPNEDQLTCPHLTKETERIGLIFMPGPKTKADYESACEALLQREQRFYSESKAAQAELNVYRCERQGLITLDKREELLAGRAEKNAHRREKYDVPVFLQDLGNVPDWLPIAPKEVPDQVERDEHGVPLVPLTRRDREGSLDPTSLPFPMGERSLVPLTRRDRKGALTSHSLPSPMGEMSRAPASDREGKSRPVPHPPSPSPSSSAPSASGVHPPGRAVNETLSPLAAARRAAKAPTTYQPKRLIHPPPLARIRPNSS